MSFIIFLYVNLEMIIIGKVFEVGGKNLNVDLEIIVSMMDLMIVILMRTREILMIFLEVIEEEAEVIVGVMIEIDRHFSDFF